VGELAGVENLLRTPNSPGGPAWQPVNGANLLADSGDGIAQQGVFIAVSHHRFPSVST